jgi:hypothetical protein
MTRLDSTTRDDVRVRLLADNVLAAHQLTDAATRAQGAAWYLVAYDEASRMAIANGLSLRCAIGIIAALSPRARWARNISAAHALAAGLPVTGMLRRSVTQARAILAGADPLDVLGGPKVRAFYVAILSRGTAGIAVVDAHAVRVATRGAYDAVAPCRYADVATAYAIVADTLQLPVHTVQATTWIAVRGSGE